MKHIERSCPYTSYLIDWTCKPALKQQRWVCGRNGVEGGGGGNCQFIDLPIAACFTVVYYHDHVQHGIIKNDHKRTFSLSAKKKDSRSCCPWHFPGGFYCDKRIIMFCRCGIGRFIHYSSVSMLFCNTLYLKRFNYWFIGLKMSEDTSGIGPFHVMSQLYALSSIK